MKRFDGSLNPPALERPSWRDEEDDTLAAEARADERAEGRRCVSCDKRLDQNEIDANDGAPGECMECAGV